jgi:hypothetical protein
LLKADDNEAVSVEAADDVVLNGVSETLYQLKHSTGRPPSLTLASTALWKTLAIWSASTDLDRQYVLVSCAKIPLADPIHVLTDPTSDRKPVLGSLVAEAERVLEDINLAKAEKKSVPHSSRESGC